MQQAIGIDGTQAVSDNSTNASPNYHFDIQTYRENMGLVSPVNEGIVTDWDLLEKLWDYSMQTYLQCDLKDKPVLVSEKPYSSLTSRHK